jgi:hypothetical protein
MERCRMVGKFRWKWKEIRMVDIYGNRGGLLLIKIEKS